MRHLYKVIYTVELQGISEFTIHTLWATSQSTVIAVLGETAASPPLPSSNARESISDGSGACASAKEPNATSIITTKPKNKILITVSPFCPSGKQSLDTDMKHNMG